MAGSVILLMGPTGAGKSAQAEALSHDPGVKHLSSGELLRDHGTSQDQQTMAQGNLVASPHVESILLSALQAIEPNETIVLDGFPRDLDESQWLTATLPSLQRQVSHVIFLTVGKDEVVRRVLGRGRPDDQPAAIATRWELYHEQTRPVIEEYRRQGVLLQVDGTGSVEQVTERIRAAL